MECYYCKKEVVDELSHWQDCVHPMEKPFIVIYKAMKRCDKFYHDVWYRYSDKTLEEATRITRKYNHD
jgi:hypothetical protein